MGLVSLWELVVVEIKGGEMWGVWVFGICGG